jgi:hypothetical protein
MEFYILPPMNDRLRFPQQILNNIALSDPDLTLMYFLGIF